eukprot:TRINITY_DN28969_c1_g1_i1.p1 TRINITY_DN28969_c1_g1~~TRINITY_DN28969_c1_g1_i1.p1  ORF type:complete len:102 (+),score=13.84 TRINITY_DN28969_c1_g1_i1:595-900(+)
MYSSVADVCGDRNPFEYCNGNDPRDRLCPRLWAKGHVGGQWNSLTRGGKQNVKWSVSSLKNVCDGPVSASMITGSVGNVELIVTEATRRFQSEMKPIVRRV